MEYQLKRSKWKAFLFNDPFAIGSFFVSSEKHKSFCRPNCWAAPSSEIIFVNDVSDAKKLGYKPCLYCEPLKCSSVHVNLLIDCVESVNRHIGYKPHWYDEREIQTAKDKNIERKVLQNISKNTIQRKKYQDDVLKTVISYTAKHDVTLKELKEDNIKQEMEKQSILNTASDTYRVNLACRHLALAAFNKRASMGISDVNERGFKLKGTNRRNSILSFKELASKSKLSAWHFHRIFKSVIGITPKSYGDKCLEYISNVKGCDEFGKYDDNVMFKDVSELCSFKDDCVSLNSQRADEISQNGSLTDLSYSNNKIELASNINPDPIYLHFNKICISMKDDIFLDESNFSTDQKFSDYFLKRDLDLEMELNSITKNERFSTSMVDNMTTNIFQDMINNDFAVDSIINDLSNSEDFNNKLSSIFNICEEIPFPDHLAQFKKNDLW